MKKILLSTIATVLTVIAANAQQGVGIGTNNPQEKLDVDGAIKLGNTTTTNAGTIRWNGTDFQGYDGSSWINLGGGGSSNWTVSATDIYNANVGNVGVGVASPQQKLDVDGAVQLGTTATATAGAIRWTGTTFEGYDGSQWVDLTGSGAFDTASNVTSNSSGDYATDDFVFGSPQLDNNGVIGQTDRMFFDKSKGAFRAGKSAPSGPLSGTWDDSNIGAASFAGGNGTTASGIVSVAFGGGTTASGVGAVALGTNSTASGNQAIVAGNNLEAPSRGEAAFGQFNTVYTPTSSTGWNTADRLFVVGNGLNAGNRHNALTITKDGTMNINEAYDLPIADGTTGQVMTTDGSGVVMWQTAPADGDGDASNELQTLSISGSDVTLSNGGGTVNIPNDADWSVSGNDQYAATSGNVGVGTTTPSSKLEVQGSLAVGNGNTTTGNESFAGGFNSTAGSGAIAFGTIAAANGGSSAALGQRVTANGNRSFATGFNTTAESRSEAVFGQYTTAYTPAGGTATWNTADRLFVIGNGSNNANRHNALTITKDGTMNINEAYDMPNADGTTGQVMTTDGSGVVTWQDASGGGSDWTVVGNDQYSSNSGNVGVGISTPVNKLDVSTGRSGPFHPTDRPFYVTGNIGLNSDGPEIRHSNATQGIGFGYNTIYAAGTNANQHVNINPKGTGGVGIGTSFPSARLNITHPGDANQVKLDGGWSNNLNSNSRINLNDVNFGIGAGNYSAVGGGDATVIWSYQGANRGILFASTLNGGGTTFRNMQQNVFISGSSGNMGIGTVTPSQKLHVEGNIRMVDGNEGLGKVLTSDANGNATWQAAPADGDADSSNEIQNLSSSSSGTNRTINISSGTGTTISVADNDNDASNEIQALSISGSTVSLSNGGGSVILPSGADNLGNHLATTNLNMNLNRITTLATPTASSDAATKAYVDAHTDADSNASNELQTMSQTGNSVTLSNGGGTISVADSDNDSSNELQNLSSSTSGTNRTINIAGGTGTTISIADNDNDSSNELQTMSQTGNSVTLSNGGGTISVADSDNDASNEIQTLSISGSDVTLSNGGGTITVPGGAFATASNVTSNSPGDHTSDDFVFGSPQLDDDNYSLHDRRMFFDKSLGAFRAGRASSTQWDAANIGQQSTAFGYNTTSSGNRSMAWGDYSEATGSQSTAFGYNSEASAGSATAWGSNTIASSSNSTAFGSGCDATSGQATAFGSNSLASGLTSTAFGSNATAQGNYSLAAGRGVTANSRSEVVFGSYNTSYTPVGSSTSWNSADRIFTIGNGTATSLRSDAMVVLKNGNTGLGMSAPARTLHVSDAMRLEPTATAPASPSAGDMYFSSTTNKLMVYDGSVWQACW